MYIKSVCFYNSLTLFQVYLLPDLSFYVYLDPVKDSTPKINSLAEITGDFYYFFIANLY